MKNIIDICKELNIEIPEGKQSEFEKAVSENYKTVNEFDKKIGKLEDENSRLTEDLTTAKATLEKFKDIDPEQINKEIEDYKQKAKDLEDDYNKKLEERDFNDALKAAMDGYKFTSAAAKNAVMEEVRKAGLKLNKGVILGLDDLMKQQREADPNAFVDEAKEKQEQSKAKFTGTMQDNGNGSMTREEIMSIKDSSERQAAIAQNISLFK